MNAIESVIDFSAALTLLEEIRRFQRANMWYFLPDRYAALRHILVTINNSALKLTNEQSISVQSALATLLTIEQTVEKGMRKDPAKLDGARFNNLLAEKANGLQATLTQLKQLNASGKHG